MNGSFNVKGVNVFTQSALLSFALWFPAPSACTQPEYMCERHHPLKSLPQEEKSSLEPIPVMTRESSSEVVTSMAFLVASWSCFSVTNLASSVGMVRRLDLEL